MGAAARRISSEGSSDCRAGGGWEGGPVGAAQSLPGNQADGQHPIRRVSLWKQRRPWLNLRGDGGNGGVGPRSNLHLVHGPDAVRDAHGLGVRRHGSAQAAKEGAKDKRWEEWADFAPDDAEPDDAWYEQTQDAGYDAWDEELAATRAALCSLLRDVFGPLPFRPLTLTPSWLCWNDGTVPRLAEAVYGNRAFDHLPILADALEEAGCANTDVLAHLRGVGPHVHGCWPLDLILGKS